MFKRIILRQAYHILLLALLALIDIICTLVIFKFTGDVIDLIIDSLKGGERTKFWSDLQRVAIIIFIAIILLVIKQYFNYRQRARCILTFKLAVSKSYLDGLERIEIDKLSSYDSSSLFARLYNDLEQVSNLIFESIDALLSSLIGIVLSFAFFIFVNWQLALVILVFVAITQLVILLRGRSLETVQAGYSRGNELFSSKLQKLLAGYSSLYFADKPDLLMGLTVKVSNQQIDGDIKLRQTQRLIELLGNLLSSSRRLIVEILFLISLSFSLFSDTLTIGLLYVIIGLLDRFNGYFDSLIFSLVRLSSIRSFNKRFIIVPTSNKRTTPLRKDFNSIKFVNLSLYYDKKLVLNKLNLEFKHSKRYAIVGRSGSGKTSLLRLIMGLEGRYQGKILIDGKDYKDISSISLLPLFSYSPVDNFVFDTTIVNNVNLWTEGDITRAIRDANLTDIPDLLSDKRSALTLSEGQRQRVCLARSFFFNSPIIILDESLANLDKDNVKVIKENLTKMDDKTLIIVSHHIDKDDPFFDEIIDLEKIS